MIYAYSRLLLIALISLIAICFVLFGVRTLGLRNPHASVEHPLQNSDFFIAAQGGGGEVAPAHTSAAMDHIIQVSPKVWLQADLYLTSDKKWVMLPGAYLSDFSQKIGHVSTITWAELEKINVASKYKNSAGLNPYESKFIKALSVEELLERYPEQKIILSLQVKGPGAAESFADYIKSTKNGN